MIRLLIADDHPIVREGLKHVASQCHDITVVGEAEDFDTLLDAIDKTQPHVLLLDVSMPGPGILEVIQRLKAAVPALRILVLTIHPEEHYARRVLKAGADGFLNKKQSTEQLPSAIRQIVAGRKFVTSSLAQDLATDLAQDREGRQVHDTLSNREYEVFVRLGAGESVKRIAQTLRLSPKTVRTYRSRIMEKTNLESTAQIIFYVMHKGLILPGLDELQAAHAPKRPDRPARDGQRQRATSRTRSTRKSS